MYHLEFEETIRSAQSNYKQLVDAEGCTPGPGSATLCAKPTLPDGYQASIPDEPVLFQTMMCQSISNVLSSTTSYYTQATPPPPGQCGDGRGFRGGCGGYPKQVLVRINCNRCGKAGHYVQDFTKPNTYWYLPPDGNEDTDTNVHCKKGAKSVFTMSYFSVYKRWYYHNASGHNT